MHDIQFPSLTQFSVRGAYDPMIADPSTNRGKSDVSLDRARSSVVPDGGVEGTTEEEDDEDPSVGNDDDEADDIATPSRILDDERCRTSRKTIRGIIATVVFPPGSSTSGR